MPKSADKEPELTLEDFAMIRDFIHEKSGIFFAENKQYLVKNRLVKRMAELNIKSYRDYFYHVKYDNSLKEFNALMNLITTNETSFFRNEPQLASFSDEVLPLIIEQKMKSKGTKSIKVWSAGCSTGEEPYTLAMILLAKVPNISNWKIEVVANDISEQVLQKARKGEYTGLTLRAIPADLLDRYFDREGDIYRVKPEVKALVNFSHLNLNDERKLSLNSNCDVIFCRNVMIYFSDEVKKRIVRGYYNCLKPGGYFYVGHSETLHGVTKAFKLVYFKNALVYHKDASAISSGKTLRPAAFAGRATPGGGLAAKTGSTGARRAIDLLSKIKPMTVKK